MRWRAFVLCGAVVMLGLVGHARAQELTYRRTFGHEHQNQWHTIACARGRVRSGSGFATWIWRDGRYVGPARQGFVARSHRGHSRSSWHGLICNSSGRLRQKVPSAGYRGCAGRTQDRPCRPRHSRHRQHGRLRLCGVVSQQGHAPCADRCAPSWRPSIRRNPQDPLLWHFRFGGPDMERLVKGRERIYLDRFWNEFSATPARFSEAARRHYAKLYARPGAMRAGFAQFAAFDQDAADNKAFIAEGKLDVPVSALGGEKSFGLAMADVMRFAATNVEGGAVPDSGHWIMEENPKATVAMVRSFLEKGR